MLPTVVVCGSALRLPYRASNRLGPAGGRLTPPVPLVGIVGGVHVPLTGRPGVVTTAVLLPASPGGRQRGGVPVVAIRVRDFRHLAASALVILCA